ncbi:MAG TPA: TadE family protein, partial [Anaerolineae bacterium]|nr:TadE family protein [Anaerolineae bacterium]
MRARIFRHREDGQSLVEVAFMLPVLLLLAVGIVELGNALNAYNQTINAAREGVRFGSMGGSDNGVMTIVQGAASQLTTYDD